jgi:putative DNA primase/helicase
MNALLDAALSYAGRGWYVFPCAWIEGGACSCKDPECDSPGKHPLTPHGLLDATNDATSVREFWTKFAKANIAVVTGAKSGIAVVDVDNIDVARPELRKLLPEYDFRSVPLQKTGKGWHLIFSYPGVHVKNGTKFLPGMDSRGDGGYIMAAPSRHISGNDYEWKAALNGSIAPLPAALLLAINGPSANSNGQKPRFDSSIVWEGISEGERDATLFKYASKMRGNDTPRDLADRLIVEASARCKPPFSERKALQKVEQAYKYPAGQTAAQNSFTHLGKKPCGKKL